MKFTIDRAPLLDAIAAVKAVVPDKNNIPILTNFLITAHSDGLTITGTNLDMQAMTRVSCLVEATGSVTVEAAKLRDIVRAMPEGAEIAVAMEEHDESRAQRLRVEAGRSRFKLATLPVADFPLLEDEITETAITYPASTWARLIEWSAFSAAPPSVVTPVLCGIHMHTLKVGKRNMFRAVGASGKGLSFGEEPAPEGVDGVDIVLSADTIATVTGLIGKLADLPITLSISGTRVVFILGETTLISKLIEGTYLDYAKVIPWDAPVIIKADCALMEECVNRVAIVAVDAVKSVRFTFTAGSVSLIARDSYGQEAVEEMDLIYDGPEVSLAVPSRQFIDRLTRIRTEGFVMRFTDAAAPVLMLADGETKGASVFMPVRA